MNTKKQAYAEYLLENMTWPEKILWSRLKRQQLGYSFQRQAILFGYIVDFWCPTARVVVELDGSIHKRPQNIKADEERDRVFAKLRIVCLRFENSDVYDGMGAVLIRIWDHCYRRAPFPIPLKPFWVLGMHSSEENVEISALSQFIENKRIEMRAKAFSQRYWKNRQLPVYRKPR